MSYRRYQDARDNTWRLLIDMQIRSLPVSVIDICKRLGIRVQPMGEAASAMRELQLAGYDEGVEGYSMQLNGQTTILYNDDCNQQRRRFTVAHELGHILMDHVTGCTAGLTMYPKREPLASTSPLEMQANVFARDLLAPACVLWGLGVNSAGQIARLCNISMEAAGYRWERMQELYERERRFLATRGYSCFLLSPLERQVYEQFKPFIEENRPR